MSIRASTERNGVGLADGAYVDLVRQWLADDVTAPKEAAPHDSADLWPRLVEVPGWVSRYCENFVARLRLEIGPTVAR